MNNINLQEIILEEILKVNEKNNLKPSLQQLQQYQTENKLKQFNDLKDFFEAVNIQYIKDNLEQSIINIELICNFIKKLNQITNDTNIIIELIGNFVLPQFFEQFYLNEYRISQVEKIYVTLLNDVLIFLNANFERYYTNDKSKLMYIRILKQIINLFFDIKQDEFLKLALSKQIFYSQEKLWEQQFEQVEEILLYQLQILNDILIKSQQLSEQYLITFEKILRYLIVIFQKGREQKTFQFVDLQNKFLFYLLQILRFYKQSTIIFDCVYKLFVQYTYYVEEKNIKIQLEYYDFFHYSIILFMKNLLQNFDQIKNNESFIFQTLKNIAVVYQDDNLLQTWVKQKQFLLVQPSFVNDFVKLSVKFLALIQKNFSQNKIHSLQYQLNIINDKILQYINNLRTQDQLDQYQQIIQYLDEFKIAKKSKSKFEKLIEKLEQESETYCPNLIYFFNRNFNGETLTHLLGQDNDLSKQRRQKFLRQFKFEGKSVLDSLREFFLLFEQKGETQCIERILEEFSYIYQSQNQHVNQISADQAHTLSFAILMLNTDLHNEQIEPQNKMTQESFLKTVRYVLDETKLSDDKIIITYENIKKTEIKFFCLERMQKKEKNYQYEEYLYFCKMKKEFLDKVNKKFLTDKLQNVYQNLDLSQQHTCELIIQRYLLKTICKNFLELLKINCFNNEFSQTINKIIKSQYYLLHFQNINFIEMNIRIENQSLQDQWILLQVILFLSSKSLNDNQYWIIFRKIYLKKFLFILATCQDKKLKHYRSITHEIRKYMFEKENLSKSKSRFSFQISNFLTFNQNYTDEIYQLEELQIRNIQSDYVDSNLKKYQQFFQDIISNYQNVSELTLNYIFEDLKEIQKSQNQGLDFQYLLLIINDICSISKNRQVFIKQLQQIQPINQNDLELKNYLQLSNYLLINLEQPNQDQEWQNFTEKFNSYTQQLKMITFQQINEINIDEQNIDKFIYFIQKYLQETKSDTKDLDLNALFVFLEKSIEKILDKDFSVYKYFVFSIIDNIKSLDIDMNFFKFYFQIIIKLEQSEDQNESNEFLILILQNLDLQNINVTYLKYTQTLFALIDKILNMVNLNSLNEHKVIYIQEQIENLYNCTNQNSVQVEYWKIILKYYTKNFNFFLNKNFLDIIEQAVRKFLSEKSLLEQNKQLKSNFGRLTQLIKFVKQGEYSPEKKQIEEIEEKQTETQQKDKTKQQLQNIKLIKLFSIKNCSKV